MSHGLAKERAAIRVPVLKMPPDMAFPALRLLAENRSFQARRDKLCSLKPSVPPRTLLNAYVLPSLNELRLFEGTLRSGQPTRYGRSVAQAPESQARVLMARHLVALDAEWVGLIEVLKDRTVSRRRALRDFAEERGIPESARVALFDRLGKWAGYLIFFGIVREQQEPRVTWSASRRQIEALGCMAPSVSLPSHRSSREALLNAYATTTRQVGTRLYIPIPTLRDELGRELEHAGILLTDSALDDILRMAPNLLSGYVVSFSPFSGPARGGLQLDGMYAGFISVRRDQRRT